MALNSIDVVAGNDTLADEYNLLRQDVRESNIDINTRYYSIASHGFSDNDDVASTQFSTGGQMLSNSNTAQASAHGAVFLPNGSIVTSLKVYWFRNDAAATGTATLFRVTQSSGGVTDMAIANSDSTSGNHTVEDTSITNATIDNTQYGYYVLVTFNPNDIAGDVKSYGALITYTIINALS